MQRQHGQGEGRKELDEEGSMGLLGFYTVRDGSSSSEQQHGADGGGVRQGR